MTEHDYPETPALDKLLAAFAEQPVLSRFVLWLEGQGMAICEWRDDFYAGGEFSVVKDYGALFVRFFDLDAVEAERERDAIDAYIRRLA